MIDGYKFVKGIVQGTKNTIYWRCAQSKKFNCSARVKTKGKQIEAHNIIHNHDAPKDKAFSAVVWKEKN